MSRRTSTIEPGYFDELYQGADDPWAFRTSDYEREKYAATLQAFSRPRYGAALEVGCSIGVFTAMVAPRCDKLVALDASPIALERAKRACTGRDNVEFKLGTVPGDLPNGPFELVILSEVLYYLDRTDLRRMADRCAEALSPDGEIVVCHWLGETDYPLTGAEATDLFAASLAMRLPSRVLLHDDVYRLERLGALPRPPATER